VTRASISVDIGRFDRGSLTQQYVNIAVEQELRNPLYVAGDAIRHDQLLLKLSSSTTATPIKINLDPDLPGLNVDVTVVGWGLTDGGNEGSLSSVLQETQLQTISNSECSMSSNPSFPWTNYAGLIFDDMLCAYSFGTDSCQGDSGGPLIMTTSDGDLQIGIVSWGFGCAQQYFPGSIRERRTMPIGWSVPFVKTQYRRPTISIAAVAAVLVIPVMS
jgi:trypsin